MCVQYTDTKMLYIYIKYQCIFPQGLELNEKKLKILSYVESRMSFIAPNLSAIVGPTVATKLMGECHNFACAQWSILCNATLVYFTYMYVLCWDPNEVLHSKCTFF